MKMPKQATPLKGRERDREREREKEGEREILSKQVILPRFAIFAQPRRCIKNCSLPARFSDGFQNVDKSGVYAKIVAKFAGLASHAIQQCYLAAARYIEHEQRRSRRSRRASYLVSDIFVARRFHRSTPNRRSFIATTSTLVREQTIFAIARAGQPAIKPVNI